MRNTTMLAALTAVSIPAVAAPAAQAESARAGSIAHIIDVQQRAAARQAATQHRLVADHVRLKHDLAVLRGERLDSRRYALNVATVAVATLRRENAGLRRAASRERASGTASAPTASGASDRAATSGSSAGGPSSASTSASSGSSTAAGLQAIAQCESGGNASAVGGGGAYRGKYQFDQQTWQSVGGSGDPAAASGAEQDRRAAMLYSRSGTASWPVCGK